MTLNLFFDKIYVINLKKRKDRLKQVTEELNKHNIDFQIFQGVEGNPGIPLKNDHPLKNKPGHVGCVLSHVAILKEAKKLNLKNVLILEDDVIFYENYLSNFKLALTVLPNDWEMLYLSGNTEEIKLKHISENVYRCFGTFTTHAYAIKSELFDEIIQGQSKLDHPVDVFYNKLILPKRKGYIIRPYLCKQRASHSDIVNGFRNYTLK